MPERSILGPDDFDRISEIAHRRWGLVIRKDKRAMVEARMTKLLRRTRIESVRAALDLVEAGNAAMQADVFDVLSTNLTHFFRESAHLDQLAQALAANQDLGRSNEPIRIWSAGCSSGCEPYSISITLREALPQLGPNNYRILATDFAKSELATASRGVYPTRSVENAPPGTLERYFEVVAPGRDGSVRVRADVQGDVTFAQLNLIEPWPMRSKFDAIFCRNVMIYFDDETIDELVVRFREQLRPGGHLFIGMSENLRKRSDLERVAPSAFRRCA